MRTRRLGSGTAGMRRSVGLAMLIAVGCSPQEELKPDPGVSPFYPGPSADKKAPGGAGSVADRAADVHLEGLAHLLERAAALTEDHADADLNRAQPVRLGASSRLLPALREVGEEVFARSRDDTMRALGAICAKQECLSCHSDRQEGDLLGAFSYTLRVAEYKMLPKHFGRAADSK